MILMQIGNGATSALLQAVGKRPLIEVKAFIATLIKICMSDVEEL
jgi:hypothetical protein